VKNKIDPKRRADKRALAVAIKLVKEQVAISSMEEIKKQLGVPDEARRFYEAAHKACVETDGEYRRRFICEKAKTAFVSKKRYLKQASKKAFSDFMEEFDNDGAPFKSALEALSDPNNVESRIKDAQDEISHNRSGTGRNLFIGVSRGFWYACRFGRSNRNLRRFPAGDSVAMRRSVP
jgi:hypothetical protein